MQVMKRLRVWFSGAADIREGGSFSGLVRLLRSHEFRSVVWYDGWVCPLDARSIPSHALRSVVGWGCCVCRPRHLCVGCPVVLLPRVTPCRKRMYWPRCNSRK